MGDKDEIIKKLREEVEEIDMAAEILERVSQDEHERAKYESRLKWILERNTFLYEADKANKEAEEANKKLEEARKREEEARKESEEARKESEEARKKSEELLKQIDEEKNKAIKVAENFINMGLTPEQIATATELPIEVVMQIKEKHS